MTDERRLSELFEESIDRRRFDGRTAPPILSISGTPDSGLDTVLEKLSATMTTRAPWARLRGHDFPDDAGSLPVTLSVANRLSRAIPRFGELRLPRFLLGFMVTRAPLPGELQQERRADVIRRIETDRTVLRQWIERIVRLGVDIAGAPMPAGDLISFAAGATFHLASKEVDKHSRAMQWYRTALGAAHHAEPTSVLIDLSDLATTAPGDVDKVLCRALLADLRAAYPPRTMRFFARETYCALLISEADVTAVRIFLDTVAEERQDLPWDPLTIVTTSTRRESAAAATKASDASLGVWLRRRTDRRQRDVATARYLLAWEHSSTASPFTGPSGFRPGPRLATRLAPAPGEAERAVPVLSEKERKMMTFVHRVTGGHPKGEQLVLDVLHDNKTREVLGDRRDLLGRDHGGRPLDEVITDDLVLRDEQSRRIGAQVVYLAMARDAGTNNLNRVLSVAPRLDSPNDLPAFRDHNAWVEYPTVGEPERPPMLHPLARRAIAHRLGRRVGWFNLVWENVHDRLSAAAGDDRVTRLYHDLAAGRVRQVSDEVDGTLGELETAQWFDELSKITQAPVREPAGGNSAQDNVSLLANTTEHPESRVGPALLVAMQLHTDPLGDPEHQLCSRIAHQLAGLYSRATDADYLLRRATEFDACSRRWVW